MWRRQLLALALITSLATPAPAQQGEDDLADIVVVARPGPPPPPRAPVDYLRRFCAEPMRRVGRFAPIGDDPDWTALDPSTRVRFGVTDPASAAFGFADVTGERTLLIKQERLVRPQDGMVEQRCTLVVIGGADQSAKLRDSISRFVGGPGTQRHVGERDGAPPVKGWQQWLWTAYPSRGAKRWQLVEGSGAARGLGSYLVVTDPRRFYATHDYIFFDLKVRVGGAVPLAVASFVKVSAPDKVRGQPERAARTTSR